MENNAFVVFKAAGKQFKVSAGSRISIDQDLSCSKNGSKNGPKIGDIISFDKVLLANSASETKVGKPFVSGITVQAKVLGTKRAPKVIIFKKKRRTGYTKKQGHRQNLLNLEIEKIQGI